MRRRAFLATCGIAGCVTSSGCNAWSDSLESGDLVIDNDETRSYRVSVTLWKTSSDPDAVPENYSTTPATPAQWQRESVYEVAAESELRESDFITEPGAYCLKARLETGDTAVTWINPGPSANDGEIAGGYAYVYIQLGDLGARMGAID